MVFGWGRDAVQLGLQERRTGILCVDDYSSRGRHTTEDKFPELTTEIQALVEPLSQADPKFQTTLADTRMTAQAVREQLPAKASQTSAVPPELTLHDILNRLGYRLRRDRKTTSQKLPETDAIFAHLQQVHTQAADDPQTLPISLDTNAKVKIGEFTRHGVARGQEAVAAADHDKHPDGVLAPAGILEVDSGQLNVVFGTSRDISDFVADCLELWWTNRQTAHPHVRRQLINLDNDPEIGSSRTQFMKRLVKLRVEFGACLLPGL